MTDDDAVGAQLLDLYRAWMGAWRADGEGLDLDVLNRIKHDSAVFTYPDGRRFGREAHNELQKGVTVLEHDLTDFRCKVYGDTAIVWFDHTLKAQGAEGKFADVDGLEARMRSGIVLSATTVWKRFGEIWRVVAQDAHVSEQAYLPRGARPRPDVMRLPEL